MNVDLVKSCTFHGRGEITRIKVADQDEVSLFIQFLQRQNYKSRKVESLVHHNFGEMC